MLYSYNQYNEIILNARFELPAKSSNSYNLKIELSSDTNISNWNSITWDKSISHYKFGDYNATDCDLDENEYTILFTPKKENTLIKDHGFLIKKDRFPKNRIFRLKNILK
jgi:hypothetical protein